MKLHISSTPEIFSNGILGYVVLSAKSLPALPFLSSQHPVSSHIRGGVNGTTVFESSFKSQIFYPAKNIVFNTYSSSGYEKAEDLSPVVDALSNLQMDQEGDTTLHESMRVNLERVIQPFTSLCLERSDPFGMTVIVSKEAPLHWYGLYNDSHALLVVTNIDNYDVLLDNYFKNSWWVYRFANRDSQFCVLHTRRMCSRWFRWSSNAHTANEFNRFAALERSLFKDELQHY